MLTLELIQTQQSYGGRQRFFWCSVLSVDCLDREINYGQSGARIISVLIVVTLLALFASSEAKANDRESSTLDVAIPLIARWEGVSTTAYLDIVGVPDYLLRLNERRSVRHGENFRRMYSTTPRGSC